MNKQFLILTFLIVLLQACKTKKSNLIRYSNVLTNQSTLDAVSNSCNNLQNNCNVDEDIDSFEFENQENLFIVNALNHNSENELILENIEGNPIGDRYNDSAIYGFQIIYFDFDAKNIKQDQISKLEKNLELLKKLISKGYDIAIEGHACDSAGSAEYNLMLSEDRSQVVIDYFVKNGIEKEKLLKVARGCQMKIVPYGNKEQQSPNRRVEIFAYLRK